jgi:hypothetical protein
MLTLAPATFDCGDLALLYPPLETRVEIMPIEKSHTAAERTPARSEHYIARSKESTRTSRELMDNSRILRLASIALYRSKGRRRTAASKSATETV